MAGSERIFPIPLARPGAAINAFLSLASTTPASCPTFAFFQQRLAALVSGDSLEVAERIAHEVDRGAFHRQGFCALVGEDDGDGVEQHGRRPRQLSSAASIEPSASCAPPTLGRSFFTLAPASVAAFLIFLMAAPSGAVRNQGADRTPGQRGFHLADNLQCRRRCPLLHRRCRHRRTGYRVQTQARSDPLGQILFDMEAGGQPWLRGCADVRPWKARIRAPRRYALFVRGLAEIELPRLAVVVGEGLGADATFLAGSVMAAL